MFYKKRSSADPKSVAQTTSVNIIGQGTTIQGQVLLEGDVRIDGKVFGDITSEGKIVIGNSGFVEGKIMAKSADVSGEVRGDLSLDDMLGIKYSGKVYGDILTTKLLVEPGAVFNGRCSMERVKKNEKNFSEGQERGIPEEELA